MNPDLEHLVADARNALGQPGEVIGGVPGSTPRFELFHGANSICSQKVRAVLAHHAIPYTSHVLNMFGGQTYLPAHVRMRMAGCDRLGGPLQSTHSGSTSATAGGCDGAVVPTLIDWRIGEVVVDSKRICSHLDATMPVEARLRPDDQAAAIDTEIDVVDNLPNYQMLVGQRPDGGHSAATSHGGKGSEMSLGKVRRCDEYLAQHAGDEVLVRAYTAKRAKELDAAQQLFSADAMRAAYDRAEAACRHLEGKLAGRESAWLLGPAFTMADLYWAVELLRMKNLGAAVMWEDGRLKAVTEFIDTVERVPAIRFAVLEWPGSLY